MNKDIYTLASDVVKTAFAKKITISFAESCTGGLAGAAVTEIAGSSEIFLGSAVTYSNEAKHNILGVSSETLKQYGAVSSECALEMAEGTRNIYCADFSVSVTGVAGPGGGTPDKPVGTVWFGFASAGKEYTFVRHFDGSRDDIREAAVKEILSVLLKEMK